MENPDNIVFFCKEHVPVSKEYQGSLSPLLGGWVKTSFKANLDPRVRAEHMWVKVSAVKADSIIGTLDNEPAFTDAVKLGDIVKVARHAIEDWTFK